ncbi:MAG: trypsin-like peptidase domain-containing protein [Sphingobium sp.]|uniref:trypsin-like peptidase domain-containing protein n=1 Tax=Sphingobium sp. TaxID=1912891 RepID=UPI0029A9FE4D|nr:trypsin-like peptidase domain-containing protein [Sphingobium sp.]MDX3910889.1 trypsin-like peptidase domain-containing protein [Sphingobium sp.]
MQTSDDPNSVHVDVLSLSAVRLDMIFDEMVAAAGTGFLWERGAHVLLVTAWHNVTGTHPHTGLSLSKTGIRPNKIRAHFRTSQPQIDQVLVMPLYHEDGAANWLIHPDAGEVVDVAVMVIPVPLPPSVLAQPVNKIAQSKMATPVGTDAFIVGYPKGLSDFGLPIWKRASIATEPKMFADESDRRRVLVDSASREGMSGSPVVARTLGAYVAESGTVTIDQPINMRFLGVYSGRLQGKDTLDAQLGIVWPGPLIDRIIDNGVIDRFKLDGAYAPRSGSE